MNELINMSIKHNMISAVRAARLGENHYKHTSFVKLVLFIKT